MPGRIVLEDGNVLLLNIIIGTGTAQQLSQTGTQCLQVWPRHVAITE
jgi:hypothetical protein